MFSNFMIGLVAGIGISAWVYAKVLKTTGGRTKDALIVGAIAGAGSCVLLMTILSAFF